MSFGLPSPRRLTSLAAALLAVAGLLAFTSAGAARAASNNMTALILCSTSDNGVDPSTGNCTGTAGLEQQQAVADGYTVTQIDDTDWKTEATTQGAAFFEQYQLIIFGDPVNCNVDTAGPTSVVGSTASVWEQAVMSSGGNKVLLGTQPTRPFVYGVAPQVPKLEAQSLAYAGAVTGATGVYLSMNCSFDQSAPGTGIDYLNGLSNQTPPSGTDLFTVQGYNAPGYGSSSYCDPTVHIVAAAGPTAGLTADNLSGWDCSVHAVFDAYPSDYTPLAVASSSYPNKYCARDANTASQACGTPYILISGGGVRVSSQISLSPSSQTQGVTSGTSTHTALTAAVTSNGNPYPGASVTFTVTNGPDAGETYTNTTDSTGHVSFTDTNTYGIAGTDTITAVATDAAGSREEAVGSVTWQQGDNVSASGSDINGYSAVALGSPTVATFSDTVDTTTAGDWTASIDWGDGSTSQGVVSGSAGNYTVTGDHTYATNGVYVVQVTIGDASLPADTATTSSTATITQAPLDIKVGSINTAEGQPVTGQIATMTGGPASNTAISYTATIDWGDGSTSVGTISGSNSSFTIDGSHTYSDAGSYTVTVKAVETANTSDKASGTATATVTDEPLAVTAHSFTVTVGHAYAGTVATFTDGNALTPASTYLATIDWGDGHTSAGTVSGAAGAFVVSGNHTYSSVGSFPVLVTVQEARLPATAAHDQGAATTTDAPLSAHGEGKLTSATQTFNGLIATFTDGNPAATAGSFTAQISWGDGTSSHGTVSGSAGSYRVNGTHTFSGPGPFTVKVTITDAAAHSASAITTIVTASSATLLAPHSFSAHKFLCGAKRHAKCSGLKISGTFPAAGSAVWKLALTKAGGTGTPVALGTLTQTVTQSGTVTLHFKVASKAKAKKLYKKVIKKHMTNLVIQQTFTNSAGVPSVASASLKLTR